LVERHPRPIVVEPPATPQDACGALEVALLADRLTQGRVQPFGIDDVVLRRRPDVPLPGAVAALAADDMAAEDRLAVTVEGVLHGLDAMGMTVQANRLDEPARPRPRGKARRQAPDPPAAVLGLLLREVADRRLEDEAVADGEVRMAPHPGPDDVGRLVGKVVDRPSGGIEARLA